MAFYKIRKFFFEIFRDFLCAGFSDIKWRFKTLPGYPDFLEESPRGSYRHVFPLMKPSHQRYSHLPSRQGSAPGPQTTPTAFHTAYFRNWSTWFPQQIMGKSWENHGKIMGNSSINGDFHGILWDFKISKGVYPIIYWRSWGYVGEILGRSCWGHRR